MKEKNLWNKKARWGLSHHHRTAYVLFSHISKKKAQEQEWRLNKLLQDLSPALLTHTSVIRLNCQEPSVKGSDFVQFLLWCQVAANLVFKRNSNRKCEIIEMWGQYEDLKVQVIYSNENEKKKQSCEPSLVSRIPIELNNQFWWGEHRDKAERHHQFKVNLPLWLLGCKWRPLL